MKITKRVNFRVVVEPYNSSYRPLTEERAESECKTLKAAIVRHVDDIGEVWVEHDTESTCEFCGCDWSDWSDYPECCGKAQDEHAAAQHLVEAPNV